MRTRAFTVAALVASVVLGACAFVNWNERGVELTVTNDGKVFFDVLNRVAEEQGCKEIKCPQLLTLLDKELRLQGKCPFGRTDADVMPVRGYVHITTRCKAA